MMDSDDDDDGVTIYLFCAIYMVLLLFVCISFPSPRPFVHMFLLYLLLYLAPYAFTTTNEDNVSLLFFFSHRPTTDGVDPAQSASPIRLQQAQEEEVSNLLLASQ